MDIKVHKKYRFNPGGQPVVVPDEEVTYTVVDDTIDKTAPSRQTLPQYLFQEPVDLKSNARIWF